MAVGPASIARPAPLAGRAMPRRTFLEREGVFSWLMLAPGVLFLLAFAVLSAAVLCPSMAGAEGWSATGSLQVHRSSAVVVRLADGRVLAAGGVVRYMLLCRETGRGWVVLAEQSITLNSTPRMTRLLAPYPNPANPRVVIPFMLARRQQVRVTVHDAAGREVARLDGGELGPGAGQVVWSGEDTRGRAVASGVYVVRLVTREGAQTRKLVVAK